jgi:hypothetical protein
MDLLNNNHLYHVSLEWNTKNQSGPLSDSGVPVWRQRLHTSRLAISNWVEELIVQSKWTPSEGRMTCEAVAWIWKQLSWWWFTTGGLEECSWQSSYQLILSISSNSPNSRLEGGGFHLDDPPSPMDCLGGGFHFDDPPSPIAAML